MPTDTTRSKVPVTARYVEFTGTSTYYSNGGLGPPAGGDRAGLVEPVVGDLRRCVAAEEGCDRVEAGGGQAGLFIGRTAAQGRAGQDDPLHHQPGQIDLGQRAGQGLDLVILDPPSGDGGNEKTDGQMGAGPKVSTI